MARAWPYRKFVGDEPVWVWPAPAMDMAYPSAAHERIPEAQPMDEAPPGEVIHRSEVAQSVEQPPVKRPVAGSSPALGAIHPFVAEAERHAYKWKEPGRPLPFV